MVLFLNREKMADSNNSDSSDMCWSSDIPAVTADSSDMSWSSDANSSEEELFICPISTEPIQKFGMTLAGHVYELELIKLWFANGNRTDPWTNIRLPACRVYQIDIKTQEDLNMERIKILKKWKFRNKQLKSLKEHYLKCEKNDMTTPWLLDIILINLKYGFRKLWRLF